MFLALICALISNVLASLAPLIVGRAIDKVVGKGNVQFDYVIKILVILGLLYCISAAFMWIFSIFANFVAYSTTYDLRKEAFYKITKLPLKFFDENAHGDTMSKLTNDIDAVSDGLFQAITQFYPGIVTILSSLILMLYLSVKITLVILIMTPFCFIIASYITKNSNKMFKQQQNTIGELNGYIEEIIGNQKVVKAFGYEERSQKQFEKINDKLYGFGQKAQFYSSLTNPATRFVNNITYILVGIVGGILAVISGLSVGKISSFLTYSTQFSQPINNVTSVAAQLQAALAAAERIFSILDENEQTKEALKTEKIQVTEGNVQFKAVNFSYNEDRKLIEDLNLKVEKGDTIAIVGPTGAGKTTLVNLIMRFYDINSGSILIDNKDISHFTRASVRTSIGMVLQDTWLFSGTIKDNISYAKPEATMEEIIAAAKSANIHSYIKRLPEGYNTIISEAGGNLSEGQKQLLTIARVMLKSPPILILDEATSSVDTRTEAHIQKAFAEIMKNRTTFIIAHRLSTIRDADLILVMNNGNIVEKGNHKELIKKDGFYNKLYKSQFENRQI
jgi:ABC-type multidrug transport system fused ATPase/permease subunit